MCISFCSLVSTGRPAWRVSPQKADRSAHRSLYQKPLCSGLCAPAGCISTASSSPEEAARGCGAPCKGHCVRTMCAFSSSGLRWHGSDQLSAHLAQQCFGLEAFAVAFELFPHTSSLAPCGKTPTSQSPRCSVALPTAPRPGHDRQGASGLCIWLAVGEA